MSISTSQFTPPSLLTPDNCKFAFYTWLYFCFVNKFICNHFFFFKISYIQGIIWHLSFSVIHQILILIADKEGRESWQGSDHKGWEDRFQTGKLGQVVWIVFLLVFGRGGSGRWQKGVPFWRLAFERDNIYSRKHSNILILHTSSISR